MRRCNSYFIFWVMACLATSLQAEPQVFNLWPDGKMPGPAPMVDGEERDLTRAEDRLIAGERIIKLGHVSTPQVHVFLPPEEKANGSAVVICPGGGFSILAWDLEGTEVAEWLNGLGIAAIVLKYRVPTRQHGEELTSAPASDSLKMPSRELGPMIDAQRSLSLTRANAKAWKLDPERIGVLGFSAGGVTGALAALANGERAYDVTDAMDSASCRADFALLIYPGGLVSKETGALLPHLSVDAQAPPMFFAHAADDRVTCLSSTALFNALNLAGVAAELHVYASGGHGYGLRRTEEPVTRWTDRAEEWLHGQGIVGISDGR